MQFCEDSVAAPGIKQWLKGEVFSLEEQFTFPAV